MAEERTAMEDADQARTDLVRRMGAVHVSRVGEMPRIQLYLDQVLSFVNDELAFMVVPGEAALTGAMVNNYVKQHMIPASERKRYTRRHLASLIFICVFKRVFSIAQLMELRDLCEERGVDMARAYDDLCSALEAALAREFSACSDAMCDGGEVPFCDVRFYDDEGHEVAADVAHLFSACVTCVAEKVYVEQMLLVPVRS
jgi:hypothetical protein